MNVNVKINTPPKFNIQVVPKIAFVSKELHVPLIFGIQVNFWGCNKDDTHPKTNILNPKVQVE